MKLFAILALCLAATSSFAADDSSNAELYGSIQTPAVRVIYSSLRGDILVGASITEKSDGKLLCQKVGAVVPNPVYSYSCYNLSSDGYEALAAYEAATSEEMVLGTQGARTLEKKTNAGFCRKVTVVIDIPTDLFSCYSARK